MKLLFAGLVLVLLTGCDNGRYQIAAQQGAGVWRLDTRTGEIAICGVNLAPEDRKGLLGSGKISCVTTLQ